MSRKRFAKFDNYEVRCLGCQLELERKITVPKIFQFIDMTYSDIEMMEQDVLVCPSDCGYFEIPDEPLSTFKFELPDLDARDKNDTPDLPRQLPLWPE